MYEGATCTEPTARAAARGRALRVAREAGRASAEWPAMGPQTALAAGPLGVVQAADRAAGQQFVARTRALAEFASARPASVDRAQGEPGAMSAERWASRPEALRPVSEWAVQELSIALSCTQAKAEKLLVEACTLVGRLPGAVAAIEAGMLSADHRFGLVEHVAPVADGRLRAEIEAELLRWVAGRVAKRTITTPPQLTEKARRVVLHRDARAAADALARAVARRGVSVRADTTVGMSSVTALLTTPEAQAVYATLAAHVDALPVEPGDSRSRGEKLADVLVDLVLRPGECALPPVQVTLTVVAGVGAALGGDAPAECNGVVVPAEMARQLLRALTGADLGSGVRPGMVDPTAVPDPTPALAPYRASGPRSDAGAGSADADRSWQSSDELAAGIDDWDELQRELAAAEDRWWAEFEAGLHPDPQSRGSLRGAPGSVPPPGGAERPVGSPDLLLPGAWWATADQAVQEAGETLLTAEQALGRARRHVAAAVRADAADEGAWRAGPAGRVDAAGDPSAGGPGDAVHVLAEAADADRDVLAALLGRTAGGGLADRPRLALVDALSGALVSLTDLPALGRAARCTRSGCTRRPGRCEHDLTDRPGLGAPDPTEGYRPGAALDRFIRARDRRCRFPGCRRPVAGGEIDHRLRWPDGGTEAGNLVGFCVGDHRGKHQAPGVTCDLTPAGTLVVSTPSGLTATTDPPPF